MPSQETQSDKETGSLQLKAGSEDRPRTQGAGDAAPFPLESCGGAAVRKRGLCSDVGKA